MFINSDRNQQETFGEIIRRIDPSHKYQKCFSTESALELLTEEDNVLPDLIFLDLVFRASGGKQMLKTLKASKALQGIPVCIYAESTEQSDQVETSELGAIGYIVKGQNLYSLTESVRSIIAASH